MTDHGDSDDVIPGLIETGPYSVWEKVEVYVLGLVLAALLTIAAFYVVHTHLIWGPAIPMALAVLAIAQIGVHLVFFLHITTAPDNTNNVLALAFGVLIVTLIIGGSLWIMGHLDDRLMLMGQVVGQSTR
ncbi:MAG TPA: cytochrome o ubiquinol oxidase subunit IV [Xanthobacteraceae bacterium]|nr:cytochrome o ubiquinol oxidase subunit IV [Xanthobacteraceae bacterium]